MRALIFTFFITLNAQTHALWVSDLTLNKAENLSINIAGGKAQIELMQQIQSPQGGMATFYYPHHESQNMSLFWDSDGQNYADLTGEERLNAIFNAAQATQSHLPFSLYESKHHTLLRHTVQLIPNEPHQLKLKFEVPLDFMDDVYFKNLYLQDLITSDALNITVNAYGDWKHFLPVFISRGEWNENSGQITWSWSGTEVHNAPNFRFYSSTLPEAKITFQGTDSFYQGRLFRSPETNWQQINILIDSSGSMYGPRWEQVQSWLQTLLTENLNQQSLQIANFSETINWWSETPTFNNRETQAQWMAQIEDFIPLGKTAPEALNQTLRILSEKNRQPTILIGDFTDYKIPQDFYNITWESPIFILNLGAPSEIEILSQLSHGDYFVLFNYTTNLPQAPLAAKRLNKLTPLTIQPSPSSNGFDQRPLFSTANPNQETLWIQKIPLSENLNSSPTANWIAPLWARFQVAHHLRSRLQNGNLNLGKAEAILALQNRYQLQIKTLQTESANELKTKVDNWPDKTVWQQIWQLEDRSQIIQNAPINFIGDRPLLQTVNGTEPFGYYDRSLSRPNQRIAPFSAAHRNLWLNFTPQMAPYFSKMSTGNFCLAYQCLNLQIDGESTTNFGQNLYWTEAPTRHWAKDYIETLARENIFPVIPGQNLNLNDSITRGEFIHWVGKKFYLTDLDTKRGIKQDTYNVSPTSNQFTDLKPEDIHFHSAQILKQKGIIQGFPDQTLRADQPLTRAEGVKILLAVNGFTPTKNTSIEDLPFTDITGWTIPWVTEAYKRGMVNGYVNGTFRPHQPLTRAEAAKILVESTQ